MRRAGAGFGMATGLRHVLRARLAGAASAPTSIGPRPNGLALSRPEAAQMPKHLAGACAPRRISDRPIGVSVFGSLALKVRTTVPSGSIVAIPM